MSLRPRARLSAPCVLALVAVLGGCKAKSTPTDDGFPVDTAPFADAASPATYVPRVKYVLTGLPVTDAEVQQVIADPAKLGDLVDAWMLTSAFQTRMLDFFRNAFQQNNVTLRTVGSSLDVNFNVRSGQRLERLIMDSFPRTAWQIMQEGRPFTETVTTRRFMMTTAMLAALSYADTYSVDDDGDRVDLLSDSDRGITQQHLVFDPLAADTSTGIEVPITEEQSLAKFGPARTGDWIWRIPVTGMTAGCEQELRTQRQTNPGYQVFRPDSGGQTEQLFALVFGNRGFYQLIPSSACQGTSTVNAVVPLLKDDATARDWDDWRWVSVEQLPIGDRWALPSPYFWNVPALRAATTVKLKSPRVGFLGTLAWVGNWPTNSSNQARVTANQALIVTLGQSIIPAMAIAPAPATASDLAHSTDPACAACHFVLDPLRQFFRQSYSYAYHEQLDLSQYLTPATFLVGGMNVSGHGVEGLADILATHPRFALAWAQKLQFWATSNAASESDPELRRAAHLFAKSGFDFRVLVRAVFTSPLVTLSRGALTYRQQDVVIGIARRDQLCQALSVRLGIPDLCRRWGVNQAGQMIATDTYYRAAELPSLPRNPDLFFRNSVEAMCKAIAGMNEVIDGTGARYRSTSPATVAAALEDMVTTLMGIPPGDERHPQALAILTEHYAGAVATQANHGDGAWAGAGLASAFVLACTSPTLTLVGL